MDNPCYNKATKTDCPDRHSGCGATCEKWAAYVVKRDAEYIQRQIQYYQDRERISNYKGRRHQEK